MRFKYINAMFNYITTYLVSLQPLFCQHQSFYNEHTIQIRFFIRGGLPRLTKISDGIKNAGSYFTSLRKSKFRAENIYGTNSSNVCVSPVAITLSNGFSC